MFRAIGKWFKALGYLFTFRINDAVKTLRENPGVMDEEYKEVIRQKQQSASQYIDAVSSLVHMQEDKKHKLQNLTKEITELTELKEGASAMAQELVAKHGGNSESVHADPEYQECASAFEDFSSTLAEKENRCTELESDVGELQEKIDAHKVNLQQIRRDIDKLKEERHEAVAEVIAAKEETRMNEVLSGIGEDKTADQLRELRETRSKLKAKAKVSGEVAGTDTKVQEAKFKQFARQRSAHTEFDKLIGLAKQAESQDSKIESPVVETQLPEG